MEDEGFEWDDDKAATNRRRHLVSFELAREAFHDPDALEDEDPDPHEERFKRLCRARDQVLVVVWTERGDRVRIISARQAKSHEQRRYFEQ